MINRWKVMYSSCTPVPVHDEYSDSSKGFYKYIDLDGKNADGAYIYPREKFESRLRPDYEPKDDSGNIIYNQNYPLYNFCIGFYYN